MSPVGRLVSLDRGATLFLHQIFVARATPIIRVAIRMQRSRSSLGSFPAPRACGPTSARKAGEMAVRGNLAKARKISGRSTSEFLTPKSSNTPVFEINRGEICRRWAAKKQTRIPLPFFLWLGSSPGRSPLCHSCHLSGPWYSCAEGSREDLLAG